MNGCLVCCIVLGCICVVILQFILSPVDGPSEQVLPSAETRGIQSTIRAKPRVKRYLNLPEGASVQLVYCFLMTILGTDQFFTFGISLGLAWEVPSNLGKIITKNSAQHRRDKRSLYPKVAVFIDKLGYNGEQCVHRFLCETRLKKSRELTLIEKLFQVIFTYQKRAQYEPVDKYDIAHTQKDCSYYVDTCPICLFLQ